MAVPTSWLCGVQTSVLPRFELLQTRDDHFPVFARCTLSRPLHLGSFQPPPRRYAMRPDPVSKPDEAAAFSLAMQRQLVC